MICIKKRKYKKIGMEINQYLKKIGGVKSINKKKDTA